MVSVKERIALELVSSEGGAEQLSRLMKENVWDYPRPAVCEPFKGNSSVVVGGVVIAESQSTFRTLETSHPPTYYFPPEDVYHENFLKMSDRPSASGREGQAILVTSPLKT